MLPKPCLDVAFEQLTRIDIWWMMLQNSIRFPLHSWVQRGNVWNPLDGIRKVMSLHSSGRHPFNRFQEFRAKGFLGRIAGHLLVNCALLLATAITKLILK